MNKPIVVYLPEGFADWECAFLLPELRSSERAVLVVTENGNPVKSIGGLKVSPDSGLIELDPEKIEALILVGSDDWSNRNHNRVVLDMAKAIFQSGKVIGAICGAVNALARVQILDERNHTGNDLAYLKKYVPEYLGEKKFQNERAVRDSNLVTSSGISPLHFTWEVMNALGLYSENYRKQWLAMFTEGTQPTIEFWEEQMKPG